MPGSFTAVPQLAAFLIKPARTKVMTAHFACGGSPEHLGFGGNLRPITANLNKPNTSGVAGDGTGRTAGKKAPTDIQFLFMV